MTIEVEIEGLPLAGKPLCQSGQLIHLRGLPQSHGVVALAHYLLPCSVQELGQPANTAHEETGVDVEENDSRVAVGVLPVCKKRGLRGRNSQSQEKVEDLELWERWRCLTRVKKVQRRVMVPK